MSSKVPKQVSNYMRELGRKGGSVKSYAKAEAARRNGAKRKGLKKSRNRKDGEGR